MSPDQLTQLKDVAGLTIGKVDGGSIRYLVLNHTMAPMDDPNVVKAMASAIDRMKFRIRCMADRFHRCTP